MFIPSALRKAVDLPVVGVGRFKDPLQAERALADGHCDLVGVVRGQIADADFAAKARAGAADDIRLCLSCNQECVGRMGLNRWLGCIENPLTGGGGVAAVTTRPAQPAGWWSSAADPAGCRRRPPPPDAAIVSCCSSGPSSSAGRLVWPPPCRAGPSSVTSSATSCTPAGGPVSTCVRGRRRRRDGAGRASRRGGHRDRGRAGPAVLGAAGCGDGRRRVATCSRAGPSRAVGSSWSTSSASTRPPRSPSCSPTAGARSPSSRPGMVVGQDLGVTLDLEHWNVRAAAKGIEQRTDLVPMAWADPVTLTAAAPPDRPEPRARVRLGGARRATAAGRVALPRAVGHARRRGPPRRRLRRPAARARRGHRRRNGSGRHCDRGRSSCATACCRPAPTRRPPKQAATCCWSASGTVDRRQGTGQPRSTWCAPRSGAFAPAVVVASRLAPHLEAHAVVVLPASPDGRDLAPRLALTPRPTAARGGHRGRRAARRRSRAPVVWCAEEHALDRTDRRDARAGGPRRRAARTPAGDHRRSTSTLPGDRARR